MTKSRTDGEKGNSESTISKPAAVSHLLRNGKAETNGHAESDLEKAAYGMTGILAPPIGLASIAYAAVKNRNSFSWKDDAISKLFRTKEGTSMKLGTIGTGILMAIEGYRIAKDESESTIARTGGALLTLSGASLAAMSATDKDLPKMHVPTAVTYFLASSTAMLALGAGDENKWVRRAALASGAITAAVWNSKRYRGMALKEAVSTLLIGGWVFYEGVKIIGEGIHRNGD